MQDTVDYNFLRHAGWTEWNGCIQDYFSQGTIRTISKKVSELTKGVDPKNRTIIVPDEKIAQVMDGVYQRFRPTTGDIFSRYVVPNDQQENMVQSMIDQVIEIITDNIRGNLRIEQENAKLSAWVQVYGDFNTKGLRQHAPIKLKEKRADRMMFNMNY